MYMTQAVSFVMDIIMSLPPPILTVFQFTTGGVVCLAVIRQLLDL